MSDLLTGEIPESPAASKKTTGVTKLNNRPLIAIVGFIVVLFAIAGYALKTMGDRQNKTVEQADEAYSAVKQSNFVDSYLGERGDGVIAYEGAVEPPAFLTEAPETVAPESPVKTVSMKEAMIPKPKSIDKLPGCGTPEQCAELTALGEAIAQEKMRMERLKRKNLEDAANGSMRVNFNRSGDPELGICQSEDGCDGDHKTSDQPGNPAGIQSGEQILAQGNDRVNSMLELVKARMLSSGAGDVVSNGGAGTGGTVNSGLVNTGLANSGGVTHGIANPGRFHAGTGSLSGVPTLGSGTATSQHQNAFIAANSRDPEGSDYLEQPLREPRAETELKAGTVIRAAMLTGINSDLPGQVIGQVTRNVWDTQSGEYILVPQGSRLIGVYDSAIAFGQKRVLVVWNRLIYPNGQSIRLEGMGGYDKQGQSGFKDKVNNHYGKVFGGAILFSIIGAGVSQVDDNTDDNNGLFDLESEFKKQLGQQITSLSNKYIGALLDVSPTLTIRQGFVMNVMIDKDIVLPPYDPMHRQLTSRYVADPE